MNLPHFGAAVGERVGLASGEATPDKATVDAAWLVLEAANDLGDDATVEACRRVIDADLNGTLSAQSDIYLIQDYFR